MHCVKKNNVFLARLPGMSVIQTKIIDVITSRLLLIFPEILSFWKIHNLVYIFSHFGLCDQLESYVLSQQASLSGDVDLVRVTRTYRHGIAFYLCADIIAFCPRGRLIRSGNSLCENLHKTMFTSIPLYDII